MGLAGRAWASLFALCVVASLAAAQPAAQSRPPSTAPSAPAAARAAATPSAGHLLPAPTPAFDPEAATRAWLDKLPPEQKQRSDAYFEGGYWLQLWGLLYTLGVAWVLLGSGISRRLRELAERTTRFRWLQTPLYAVGYTLLTFVLGFPLSVYEDFFREHQYGLSNLSFGGWMKEEGKGLGVGLVLGAVIFTVLYAVLRRAPRTWWLWGAMATLALLGVVLVIAPVFIAPLFNTYTPLTDPELRDPILRMAQANGVPAQNVWVFDASKQHKRISANVSGFLGTERISLNDNLLKRCTPAEIEAVMGHEIGHYVLHHVWEDFFQLGLVILLGFVFVRATFERVRTRWGREWGIRGVDDPAGLPLLAALLAVYFFVMTPVVNTIIRTNEQEADIFGLDTARQPDGFAGASIKLGEYRKLEPGPIEELLFFDHPSGRSRILMAMRWKAVHPDGPFGP